MDKDKYERKNRIEEALNIRGIKQVELCEKAGIKKASLSHWISQRWQPKQEPLFKMAEVLDVSYLWLAGYDVPMEKPKGHVTTDRQIEIDNIGQIFNVIRKDKRLTNLVVNLSRLNEAQLNTVESMVNELVKLNQPH